MPGRRAPCLAGVRLLRDLQRDTLGTFERARRELGDVVLLRPGPPGLRASLQLLFHPEAVRHVMATASECYSKDNRFYQELRWAFGAGLVTSQDERWKRQRRFIQPLFTGKRIATYGEAMAAEGAALVARWHGLARAGAPIELHGEMQRVTLRIVGRLLFGADMDRTLPVVASAFPLLGEYTRRRAMLPLPLPPSWPLPANRRARRAQAEVYRTCDGIIAERRANGGGDGDLLSLLIGARDGGEALDDEEVRDQVLIFMFAGHDTTAVALTFALYLLGRDREAQARVRAEVVDVLGGRAARAPDVEQLRYTTCVLKEAMRLYPPVWGVGRRMRGSEDEIGGYDVPRHGDVMLSPWVTHRHPEFWADPERFDPERFTPAAEAARHRHAYFPFGIGPRTCIGQSFAMLEAVILLAGIVGQFELSSLVDRVPLDPRITLHPAAPVLARVAALESRATRASGERRVG